MNQQLKESLEEFEKKLFSLSTPPLSSSDLGCWNLPLEETLVEELKDFLTTHTKKLIEVEIKLLEGMKKDEYVFSQTNQDSEMSAEIKGYNQALTDVISHLQEEIKEIKEP